MNLNIISIIPKVNGVEHITYFCPTTMVNFCFKITTKDLTDRLSDDF